MPRITYPEVREVATELGVTSEVILLRMRRGGLSLEEVRLLGAMKTGLLRRAILRKVAEDAGLTPERVLYRIAVLGMKVKEAVARGGQADPVPDIQPLIWDGSERPDFGCRQQAFRLPPPDTRAGICLRAKAGGPSVSIIKEIFKR